MSIANELTRLQNAKNSISNAIKNKGVTVPATTKLDGMAALIGQIQQGGTSVEKYTGTIKSLGEYVDVYFTDGNTLQGGSDSCWADMGSPSTNITVAKGTYIIVVGSYSPTLAGKNIGYLVYYVDAGTQRYIHIADVSGDNFEIIGG